LGQWQRGQSLLDGYPPETRAVLAERGIMLLLQTGRIDDAFALIDVLRSLRLSTTASERIDHLEAMALARDGATEEARAIWSRLVQQGAPEIRTTALQSLVEQDLAAGRITKAEALHRLDADSVHWRGQRDEFRLWQQLAKLQQETGRLETAMQTLQAALVREPPVTAAKAITTDMARLLDLLFAEFAAGERDATSMLQLFRQFTELIAAGAAGDRQVLSLSEALTELDLSGPAIELLRTRLQRSTARDTSRARLGLALAHSLASSGERQGAIAALLDTTPVEQIETGLSDARRQLLSDLGRPDTGAGNAEDLTPLAATLASARAALDRAAADPAAWREVVEATLGLDVLLPARGPLDQQASEIVLIAATAARQLGEVAMVQQLYRRYAERLSTDDDAAMLQMLASTGDLSGAAADVSADAAIYIQRLRQALAAMPSL
jgi:tetratricopeptide (TPR) repeat protein